MIKTISTTPYTDQKMGTAGLRRKSKVVMQPNYVENFMQSIFNVIGNLNGKTFVVGGDGRFYNDIAIQKIIIRHAMCHCRPITKARQNHSSSGISTAPSAKSS